MWLDALSSPRLFANHQPLPMTIGVLQLELSIPAAMSLKDKRRAVKSLKDRIAHAHNVSIAEVDALDEHRRSIIGIAMVGNERGYVEGGLSKLVDLVRLNTNVVLTDYRIDLM
jgi:uncharacterized protein YlxP (DUF503 family)